MANIPQIVDELVKKFGTKNPFEICKHLNIKVLRVYLPSNINGFFRNNCGDKCVFLSKSLSSKKAEFCCAHELGHALLHDKLNSIFLSSDTYFCTEKFENEADTFAAYLLFDDAEKLYNRLGLRTADEIANYYNIDKKTFTLRYEKSFKS